MPIPIVEAAGHVDGARIGGPDRKAGAVDTVALHHVGAQKVHTVPVLALGKQVQVQFTNAQVTAA